MDDKKYYIERYEDLSFPNYFIEAKLDLEDGNIYYRLPYKNGTFYPYARWCGSPDTSFALFEKGYIKFINKHQNTSGEGIKILEELSEEEWKLKLIKKSLK